MEVKFHGHAVVTIETGPYRLLFDPFLSGNEKCPLDPDVVDPTHIFLTHAHSDHFGDVVEIAKRTGALVIANVEIADYLAKLGIDTHGMQPGGSHVFDFGRVKFFPAVHGSSLEINGQPHTLGLACGILVESEGRSIYHMGDTGLYGDMKLIGQRESIDLAFVPIGDNFTMGPEDAALAAEWIGAKIAVPIHYDTFPLIEQDPQDFLQALNQVQGLVPSIGEPINF